MQGAGAAIGMRRSAPCTERLGTSGMTSPSGCLSATGLRVWYSQIHRRHAATLPCKPYCTIRYDAKRRRGGGDLPSPCSFRYFSGLAGVLIHTGICVRRNSPKGNYILCATPHRPTKLFAHSFINAWRFSSKSPRRYAASTLSPIV